MYEFNFTSHFCANSLNVRGHKVGILPQGGVNADSPRVSGPVPTD